MRLHPGVITRVEEVLREVLRFTGPADVTLSRFFRDHPKLGGRERNAIAEGVYAVLRNKLVFSSFSESGTGPAMRRLALLGLADAVGKQALGGLSDDEAAWLERIATIDRATLPVTLRSNLPDWLRERLTARDGEDAMLALAQALNQPASLDLRVNALKARRDDVLTTLATAGIEAEPTPYSPLGVRLKRKPALQNLPLFKDGAIEVQDEGSQLLTQLLAARRGEMVVDFCAGAGGKTLALGAAMRSTGRLYAFDVNDKRLARLKPRLARSGLSNVHPVLIAHENDAKVKRLLCMSATSTGETLNEVVRAYQGDGLAGCIMTKLDEAATVGSVLDVMIRQKLRLYYVANGQRVPEDLHVPNQHYLVDRAFKLKRETGPFQYQDEELPLVMSSAAHAMHDKSLREVSLG